MPRTCSRMSCRRGSSRGHFSLQPSSTTSEPSLDASEFSFNRYPATISVCGRGRGKIITEACSYHSQSHTARFRFPCSLCNSSFIASITIELSEDAMGSGVVGSEAVGPGAPLEPTTTDKNASMQTKATQRKDTSGPTNQETTTHAGPSAPAEGGSLGKKGQPFESEDSDQFGSALLRNRLLPRLMMEQVRTFCFCSAVVRRHPLLSESTIISCLTILRIRSSANIDSPISPAWATLSSFLVIVITTVLQSLSSWILYWVNRFIGSLSVMERPRSFEILSGSKHFVPAFSYSFKTHQVSKQVTMKDFWSGFQVIFVSMPSSRLDL